MTQREKREFLIQKLIDEQPRYQDLQIPSDATEQRRLLRSLLNVRPPAPIEEDFLAVQDEYLREETARKGVTTLRQDHKKAGPRGGDRAGQADLRL